MSKNNEGSLCVCRHDRTSHLALGPCAVCVCEAYSSQPLEGKWVDDGLTPKGVPIQKLKVSVPDLQGYSSVDELIRSKWTGQPPTEPTKANKHDHPTLDETLLCDLCAAVPTPDQRELKKMVRENILKDAKNRYLTEKLTLSQYIGEVHAVVSQLTSSQDLGEKS